VSTRGDAVRAVGGRLAVAGSVTGLMAALSPHVGSIVDGARYAQMAAHPFGSEVISPWALRIGIPLLVSILPGPTGVRFEVLAVCSLLAAGLLVAATVRRLGLPERHALAAAALTCATSLTASTFWAYYIDVHMLAFFALLTYLASRTASLWLVPLVAVGVAVKEIALLGVVLAGLIWNFERRTRWTLAGMAAAGIVTFLLLWAFVPRAPSLHGGVLANQWYFSIVWLRVVDRMGPVQYTGNALLSVFGVMWLLWPLGLGRTPAWLTRAQLWIPATLAFFITAQWERSFAYYLPIVVPVALMAVADASALELGVLTAASVWVSGVVPAHTVGGGVTPGVHKLLLMAPGLVVGGVVVARRYVEWLRSRMPAAPVEPARRRPT